MTPKQTPSEKIKQMELEEVFKISISNDGNFYAHREVEPLFCLAGETVEEAATAGKKALRAYAELIGGKSIFKWGMP